MRVTFLVSLFLASATAYNTNAPLNRRDIFRSAATAAAGTAFLSSPSLVNALELCPARSQNCIRTTWIPPGGTKREDAIATLRRVIESYPQEGQNKADLGGWTIVEDNFSSGSARVEYKSGIGNFAKFLNGGKPFVDDLKLEISDKNDKIVVEVKSSSRIGDSDLGVNQKRLNFLIAKLRADGWDAPDPAY
jgi:hypothetical protein